MLKVTQQGQDSWSRPLLLRHTPFRGVCVRRQEENSRKFAFVGVYFYSSFHSILAQRGVCPTSGLSTGAQLSSRRGFRHLSHQDYLYPEADYQELPCQNLQVSQNVALPRESAKGLDKWLITRVGMVWGGGGTPGAGPMQGHLQPWKLRTGSKMASHRPQVVLYHHSLPRVSEKDFYQSQKGLRLIPN